MDEKIPTYVMKAETGLFEAETEQTDRAFDVDPIEVFDEPFMTIPELAIELGKSITVVRRYIDAGLFPNAYKNGPFRSSQYRVPTRDIDKYKSTVVLSKPSAGDDKTQTDEPAGDVNKSDYV